jgi:hypothetical protein
MQERMSQLGELTSDVSYHDLRHPWFETAAAR